MGAAKKLEFFISGVKEKARSTTRELFDVCVESIENRSTEVLQNYEVKTQEFTSQLIDNEKILIQELDERLGLHIKTLFARFELSSDLLMGKILSFLTTVSFMYLAFQMNEAGKEQALPIMRISLTFFLLTVLVAACLRIVRFLFDWHNALKEYQRWQFLTAAITASGILSTFIVKTALSYF